jgi:ribosomal 50S subunit-recycling heat shock protein
MSPSSTTAIVVLPRSAKHASRLHATLNLSSDGLFSISVQGQNGVLIDGQRAKRGTRASWDVDEGEEIVVDFHGAKVCVTVEDLDDDDDRGRKKRQRVSMSDSESEAEDSADEDNYDGGEKRAATVTSPSSPLSSPTKSSILSDVSDQVKYEDEDSEEDSDEEDDDDDDDDQHQHQRDEPPQKLDVPPSDNAAPLDEEVVGSLASAIVFHPRSTVFFSEATAALRTSQPWLANVSTGEISRVLRNGPFGEILNNGLKVCVCSHSRSKRRAERKRCAERKCFFWEQDADDKPLEPAYYYMPARDWDLERRSSLEPFVKAIRTSQTQAKQVSSPACP